MTNRINQTFLTKQTMLLRSSLFFCKWESKQRIYLMSTDSVQLKLHPQYNFVTQIISTNGVWKCYIRLYRTCHRNTHPDSRHFSALQSLLKNHLCTLMTGQWSKIPLLTRRSSVERPRAGTPRIVRWTVRGSSSACRRRTILRRRPSPPGWATAAARQTGSTTAVSDPSSSVTEPWVTTTHIHTHWRSGVVVSALASINEVNLRRSRLVLRWATMSGFNSRCRTFISVCNQPATQGQLSLPSLRGR